MSLNIVTKIRLPVLENFLYLQHLRTQHVYNCATLMFYLKNACIIYNKLITIHAFCHVWKNYEPLLKEYNISELLACDQLLCDNNMKSLEVSITSKRPVATSPQNPWFLSLSQSGMGLPSHPLTNFLKRRAPGDGWNV